MTSDVLGRAIEIHVASYVEDVLLLVKGVLLPFQGAEGDAPSERLFLFLFLGNAEICQLPAEGVRVLQNLALLHDVVYCVELFVRARQIGDEVFWERGRSRILLQGGRRGSAHA